MKAKRLLIRFFLPILLLAGAVIGGFFLGRTSLFEEEANDRQATPTTETRRVLYWQAPMDSTEVYDQPGKSKMGMDLVPVYADDQEQRAPGPEAEREVLYWQAPMNPTEIYDRPGKSAMGMDLSRSMPMKPASAPAVPSRSTRQRSRTWASVPLRSNGWTFRGRSVRWARSNTMKSTSTSSTLRSRAGSRSCM